MRHGTKQQAMMGLGHLNLMVMATSQLARFLRIIYPLQSLHGSKRKGTGILKSLLLLNIDTILQQTNQDSFLEISMNIHFMCLVKKILQVF